MIPQIRSLQRQPEEDSLWIELAGGRIIQVYQASTSIATTEEVIAILRQTGVELIQAAQVTAVGGGIHAKELEQLEKRKAELISRFGSEA
jgi:hypothetical protein